MTLPRVEVPKVQLVQARSASHSRQHCAGPQHAAAVISQRSAAFDTRRKCSAAACTSRGRDTFSPRHIIFSPRAGAPSPPSMGGSDYGLATPRSHRAPCTCTGPCAAAGAPCCYSVCTQLGARVAQAAPRSAAALERYWLASSRARGPRDTKANDDRPRRTRRSRERLLGSRSPTTVVCPGYKAAYTYIKRFNGVIDESFYKRSMLCHVAEPAQSEARSSSSVRSETQ